MVNRAVPGYRPSDVLPVVAARLQVERPEQLGRKVSPAIHALVDRPATVPVIDDWVRLPGLAHWLPVRGKAPTARVPEQRKPAIDD